MLCWQCRHLITQYRNISSVPSHPSDAEMTIRTWQSSSAAGNFASNADMVLHWAQGAALVMTLRNRSRLKLQCLRMFLRVSISLEMLRSLEGKTHCLSFDASPDGSSNNQPRKPGVKHIHGDASHFTSVPPDRTVADWAEADLSKCPRQDQRTEGEQVCS